MARQIARHLFIIFIISILLDLCIVCCRGQVNAAGENRKVILFVLDSISITDLCHAQTPNIDGLIAIGATGLMNTATLSGPARNAAHLTIGAGARAAGSDAMEPALEIGEEWEGALAGEVYRRRLGGTPQGAIVHLGLAEITSSNGNLAATIVPGALGQTLTDAGYTCSLLGNSDVPGLPRRPAAGIAIDFAGVIRRGFIGGDLLEKNPGVPFGWEIDMPVFQSLLDKTMDSSLLVIEWGDTARADMYSRHMLSEPTVNARHRALERADAFLGQLLHSVDLGNTLLVLLSPSPSSDAYRLGDRLTPIIMAGASTAPGLLSSPTTRRPGLVANIDIAPTILDYFQLPPFPGMVGRSMTIVAGVNDLQTLADSKDVFQRNYIYRPSVIKTYIVFIIAIFAGTTLAIYRPGWWNPLLARLLIAVAAIPLVLLLLPLFEARGLGTTLLLGLFLTLLLVKIVYRGENNPRPFIALGLLTVGSLWLDLLGDQSLVIKSLLGYCPISGARYYGMGNEYMGLYLGAGLISWSGLAGELNFTGRRANSLFLVPTGILFMLLFIASPHLGANFGGTIATMWGGGVTIICLQGRKVQRKQLLIWLLGGILLLTALGLGDYYLAGEQASHLGRTVALLIGNGPREVGVIIQRKAEMNIKLLKYSWWSMILLAVLIIFLILSYYPPHPFKDLAHKFPTLWAGFSGSGMGALAAFLLNDSGVVAGATTLIFPVTTLLFLLVLPTGPGDNHR